MERTPNNEPNTSQVDLDMNLITKVASDDDDSLEEHIFDEEVHAVQ